MTFRDFIITFSVNPHPTATPPRRPADTPQLPGPDTRSHTKEAHTIRVFVWVFYTVYAVYGAGNREGGGGRGR